MSAAQHQSWNPSAADVRAFVESDAARLNESFRGRLIKQCHHCGCATGSWRVEACCTFGADILELGGAL